MKISIIVPVFNGEGTLSELYSRIEFTLKDSFEYEVLFIHDGGTSSSWMAITKLKDQHGSKIKAIKLTRNFGQHNAIICGIEKAKGDLIITMDEDLQHAPEDILKLLTCQNQNDSDIVYGAYVKRKHSGIRNIASGVLNRLLRMAIPGLHKDYSAFRLIKTNIAKQIIGMKSSYTFIDGYLSRITDKVSSTPVSHFRSEIGPSSYSLMKLIWHFVSIILEYSRNLLKNLWILSIVSIVTGTALILMRVFNISHYQGNVKISIEILFIILLLIGLFFLGLVLLGEYIRKYNLETQSETKDEILQIK